MIVAAVGATRRRNRTRLTTSRTTDPNATATITDRKELHVKSFFVDVTFTKSGIDCGQDFMGTKKKLVMSYYKNFSTKNSEVTIAIHRICYEVKKHVGKLDMYLIKNSVSDFMKQNTPINTVIEDIRRIEQGVVNKNEETSGFKEFGFLQDDDYESSGSEQSDNKGYVDQYVDTTHIHNPVIEEMEDNEKTIPTQDNDLDLDSEYTKHITRVSKLKPTHKTNSTRDTRSTKNYNLMNSEVKKPFNKNVTTINEPIKTKSRSMKSWCMNMTVWGRLMCIADIAIINQAANTNLYLNIYGEEFSIKIFDGCSCMCGFLITDSNNKQMLISSAHTEKDFSFYPLLMSNFRIIFGEIDVMHKFKTYINDATLNEFSHVGPLFTLKRMFERVSTCFKDHIKKLIKKDYKNRFINDFYESINKDLYDRFKCDTGTNQAIIKHQKVTKLFYSRNNNTIIYPDEEIVGNINQALMIFKGITGRETSTMDFSRANLQLADNILSKAINTKRLASVSVMLSEKVYSDYSTVIEDITNMRLVHSIPTITRDDTISSVYNSMTIALLHKIMENKEFDCYGIAITDITNQNTMHFRSCDSENILDVKIAKNIIMRKTEMLNKNKIGADTTQLTILEKQLKTLSHEQAFIRYNYNNNITNYCLVGCGNKAKLNYEHSFFVDIDIDSPGITFRDGRYYTVGDQGMDITNAIRYNSTISSVMVFRLGHFSIRKVVSNNSLTRVSNTNQALKESRLFLFPLENKIVSIKNRILKKLVSRASLENTKFESMIQYCRKLGSTVLYTSSRTTLIKEISLDDCMYYVTIALNIAIRNKKFQDSQRILFDDVPSNAFNDIFNFLKSQAITAINDYIQYNDLPKTILETKDKLFKKYIEGNPNAELLDNIRRVITDTHVLEIKQASKLIIAEGGRTHMKNGNTSFESSRVSIYDNDEQNLTLNISHPEAKPKIETIKNPDEDIPRVGEEEISDTVNIYDLFNLSEKDLYKMVNNKVINKILTEVEELNVFKLKVRSLNDSHTKYELNMLLNELGLQVDLASNHIRFKQNTKQVNLQDTVNQYMNLNSINEPLIKEKMKLLVDMLYCVDPKSQLNIIMKNKANYDQGVIYDIGHSHLENNLNMKLDNLRLVNNKSNGWCGLEAIKSSIKNCNLTLDMTKHISGNDKGWLTSFEIDKVTNYLEYNVIIINKEQRINHFNNNGFTRTVVIQHDQNHYQGVNFFRNQCLCTSLGKERSPITSIIKLMVDKSCTNLELNLMRVIIMYVDIATLRNSKMEQTKLNAFVEVCISMNINEVCNNMSVTYNNCNEALNSLHWHMDRTRLNLYYQSDNIDPDAINWSQQINDMNEMNIRNTEGISLGNVYYDLFCSKEITQPTSENKSEEKKNDEEDNKSNYQSGKDVNKPTKDEDSDTQNAKSETRTHNKIKREQHNDTNENSISSNKTVKLNTKTKLSNPDNKIDTDEKPKDDKTKINENVKVNENTNFGKIKEQPKKQSKTRKVKKSILKQNVEEKIEEVPEIVDDISVFDGKINTENTYVLKQPKITTEWDKYLDFVCKYESSYDVNTGWNYTNKVKQYTYNKALYELFDTENKVRDKFFSDYLKGKYKDVHSLIINECTTCVEPDETHKSDFTDKTIQLLITIDNYKNQTHNDIFITKGTLLSSMRNEALRTTKKQEEKIRCGFSTDADIDCIYSVDTTKNKTIKTEMSRLRKYFKEHLPKARIENYGNRKNIFQIFMRIEYYHYNNNHRKWSYHPTVELNFSREASLDMAFVEHDGVKFNLTADDQRAQFCIRKIPEIRCTDVFPIQNKFKLYGITQSTAKNPFLTLHDYMLGYEEYNLVNVLRPMIPLCLFQHSYCDYVRCDNYNDLDIAINLVRAKAIPWKEMLYFLKDIKVTMERHKIKDAVKTEKPTQEIVKTPEDGKTWISKIMNKVLFKVPMEMRYKQITVSKQKSNLEMEGLKLHDKFIMLFAGSRGDTQPLSIISNALSTQHEVTNYVTADMNLKLKGKVIVYADTYDPLIDSKGEVNAKLIATTTTIRFKLKKLLRKKEDYNVMSMYFDVGCDTMVFKKHFKLYPVVFGRREIFGNRDKTYLEHIDSNVENKFNKLIYVHCVPSKLDYHYLNLGLAMDESNYEMTSMDEEIYDTILNNEEQYSLFTRGSMKYKKYLEDLYEFLNTSEPPYIIITGRSDQNVNINNGKCKFNTNTTTVSKDLIVVKSFNHMLLIGKIKFYDIHAGAGTMFKTMFTNCAKKLTNVSYDQKFNKLWYAEYGNKITLDPMYELNYFRTRMNKMFNLTLDDNISYVNMPSNRNFVRAIAQESNADIRLNVWETVELKGQLNINVVNTSQNCVDISLRNLTNENEQNNLNSQLLTFKSFLSFDEPKDVLAFLIIYNKQFDLITNNVCYHFANNSEYKSLVINANGRHCDYATYQGEVKRINLTNNILETNTNIFDFIPGENSYVKVENARYLCKILSNINGIKRSKIANLKCGPFNKTYEELYGLKCKKLDSVLLTVIRKKTPYLMPEILEKQIGYTMVMGNMTHGYSYICATNIGNLVCVALSSCMNNTNVMLIHAVPMKLDIFICFRMSKLKEIPVVTRVNKFCSSKITCINMSTQRKCKEMDLLVNSVGSLDAKKCYIYNTLNMLHHKEKERECIKSAQELIIIPNDIDTVEKRRMKNWETPRLICMMGVIKYSYFVTNDVKKAEITILYLNSLGVTENIEKPKMCVKNFMLDEERKEIDELIDWETQDEQIEKRCEYSNILDKDYPSELTLQTCWAAFRIDDEEWVQALCVRIAKNMGCDVSEVILEKTKINLKYKKVKELKTTGILMDETNIVFVQNFSCYKFKIRKTEIQDTDEKSTKEENVEIDDNTHEEMENKGEEEQSDKSQESGKIVEHDKIENKTKENNNNELEMEVECKEIINEILFKMTNEKLNEDEINVSDNHDKYKFESQDNNQEELNDVELDEPAEVQNKEKVYNLIEILEIEDMISRLIDKMLDSIEEIEQVKLTNLYMKKRMMIQRKFNETIIADETIGCIRYLYEPVIMEENDNEINDNKDTPDKKSEIVWNVSTEDEKNQEEMLCLSPSSTITTVEYETINKPTKCIDEDVENLLTTENVENLVINEIEPTQEVTLEENTCETKNHEEDQEHNENVNNESTETSSQSDEVVSETPVENVYTYSEDSDESDDISLSFLLENEGEDLIVTEDDLFEEEIYVQSNENKISTNQVMANMWINSETEITINLAKTKLLTTTRKFLNSVSKLQMGKDLNIVKMTELNLHKKLSIYQFLKHELDLFNKTVYTYKYNSSSPIWNECILNEIPVLNEMIEESERITTRKIDTQIITKSLGLLKLWKTLSVSSIELDEALLKHLNEKQIIIVKGGILFLINYMYYTPVMAGMGVETESDSVYLTESTKWSNLERDYKQENKMAYKSITETESDLKNDNFNDITAMVPTSLGTVIPNDAVEHFSSEVNVVEMYEDCYGEISVDLIKLDNIPDAKSQDYWDLLNEMQDSTLILPTNKNFMVVSRREPEKVKQSGVLKMEWCPMYSRQSLVHNWTDEFNTVTTRIGTFKKITKVMLKPKDEFNLLKDVYFKLGCNRISEKFKLQPVGLDVQESIRWCNEHAFPKKVKESLEELFDSGWERNPINSFKVMSKVESTVKMDKISRWFNEVNSRNIMFASYAVSAIFSPLFLKLKSRFKDILKFKYTYVDGMTPEQISAKAGMFRNVEYFVEDDLTKQDKNTIKLIIKTEALVYKFLGLDEKVCDFYLYCHDNWKWYGKGIKGICDAMRLTGQVTTSIGNTITNMIIHTRLILKNKSRVEFAMFLGDDIIIGVNKEINIKGHGTMTKDYFNMISKVKEEKMVGGFLSMIMHTLNGQPELCPYFERCRHRYSVCNKVFEEEDRDEKIKSRTLSYCYLLGGIKENMKISKDLNINTDVKNWYDVNAAIHANALYTKKSDIEVQESMGNLLLMMRNRIVVKEIYTSVV